MNKWRLHLFSRLIFGKLSGFVLTLALLYRESQNPDCQIIGAILTLFLVKYYNKEWFFCKKFSIYSTTVILNIPRYTFSWFFFFPFYQCLKQPLSWYSTICWFYLRIKSYRKTLRTNNLYLELRLSIHLLIDFI